MGERLLYSFEGIDGAGKTTSIASIQKHYQQQGFSVTVVSSPSRTLIGSTLRRHLPTISSERRERLFAYDIRRAQRTIPENTEIVLYDRHLDTVYVSNETSTYEGVLQRASGILRPPTVFLLDVPVNVALEREGQTHSHPMDAAWLTQKHQRYAELYQKDPDRFQRIDATQPAEVVVNEIIKLIDADLERNRLANTALSSANTNDSPRHEFQVFPVIAST